MQSQTRALRGFRTVFVLVAVSFAVEQSRAQSAAPGFDVRSWTLPTAARGWVDLVDLGGEVVVYDGKDLRRFESDSGRALGTLATVSAPVFGSILTLGPSKRRLFIGDSSTGTLRSFDLATKAWHKFAVLPGNYRMAFHPREGERFAYVSARPKDRAQIFRIDTISGTSTLIADVTGYSGPLLFDPAGNLYFAPAPLTFGKRGLGKLLRWTSAQVLSAITGVPLRDNDARVFAQGFDSAGDLALDGEGTIYACDQFSSATSSLLEIAGGAKFARGILEAKGQFLTSMTYVDRGKPFERFGNSESGFWVIGSDFTTGVSQVHRLSPRRPQLVASTQTPVGGGPLRYDATALPGSTLAVFLFGSGLVPESPIGPLGARGLLFPDFAIVPSAPVVVAVTRSTALGRATLQGRAPRLSGAMWTTQVLAGPVLASPGADVTSPWVTSSPVTVRVR